MLNVIVCLMISAASPDLAPTVQEVVGDLVMPYTGPMRLVVQSDGFVIDAGGNQRPWAIDAVGDMSPVDIVGIGTMQYTDGLLRVAFEDYVFEADVRYRTNEAVAADNADCPQGKNCCECESSSGGKASVVCDADERPLCTCSPCCTSTCIKTKLRLEAEEL